MLVMSYNNPDYSGSQPSEGYPGADPAEGQSGTDRPAGYTDHEAPAQPPAGYMGADPSYGYAGTDPSYGYAASQQGYADQQGYTDQQGYPSSQASAEYAASQASASYPSSHASAAYPTSQPSAAYGDHQQGVHGVPAPGHYAQGPSQWNQGPRPAEDSFFAALFDFGFTRYATPSVTKVFYVLGIAVGVLTWLGSGIGWLMIGGMLSAITDPFSTGSGGGGVFTVLGLLSWLFGLIPLFFWIVGVRVLLENALAIVRINQDSKVIREKLENPAA